MADEKVYLLTDDETYRIPTVLIDKNMLSAVPVETGSGNYAVQILMVLTLILIAGGILYRFGIKEREGSKEVLSGSGSSNVSLSEPISSSHSDITLFGCGGYSRCQGGA